MMQKIATPLFTLINPAGWPCVALRCDDPNLDGDTAHELVCEIMESSESHNIVEHIDEAVQDGTLYVVLTMHVSTTESEDARAMALGAVASIIAQTRQYVDVHIPQAAMASNI